MIGSNKIAVSIIKALFIVHYFGLAGLGIGDARWHFLWDHLASFLVLTQGVANYQHVAAMVSLAVSLV